MTYNPALPLGQHRSGGIFTPDGQGGGTLAWVQEEAVYRQAAGPVGFPGEAAPVLVGTRTVLREIRKEPIRGP